MFVLIVARIARPAKEMHLDLSTPTRGMPCRFASLPTLPIPPSDEKRPPRGPGRAKIEITTMPVPMTSSVAATAAQADLVVASIPNGRRRDELRFSFATYKGRASVAALIWYLDDAGATKPPAKGFNVRADLLPAIAERFARAPVESNGAADVGTS
ncbi:MAG: hypothetical protein IPK81_13910 [Rhodospirillales bacterium]|nr:MAG: hypothetical protein IPK81_13910 [Rhodospirillales bacterium]